MPALLPPGFRAFETSAEPFAQAAAYGQADGAPGSIFCRLLDGRGEAAVLLTPDEPVAAETLTALGQLALFDALAVLAPPQRPIEIGRDGWLLLDGGQVAQVQVAIGAGTPPDWAVLGIGVAVGAGARPPGEAPGQTCLAEEGFGDAGWPELLGQFCRHLLAWIDRWREDGAAGLDQAVAQRMHLVQA